MGVLRPPTAELYTVPITNMELSAGSIKHYYMDVPIGQTVACSADGTSGNAAGKAPSTAVSPLMYRVRFPPGWAVGVRAVSEAVAEGVDHELHRRLGRRPALKVVLR